MTTVHVGVSGFSYLSWRGKFYPEGAKSEELLQFYSSKLSTVEINSSFYASPSDSTIAGWEKKSNDGFTFAFKAPKKVTHIGRLGTNSSDDANRFSGSLTQLGPKKGPVLFQLPPFARQDLGLLESFLSNTGGISPRVFEFRHPSWFAAPTFSLLDRYGAGFCIAETEDLPPVYQVTGEVAYFRLRKDAYDHKAIDQWAVKIAKESKGARETFVYLRHDETGENAGYAQRLERNLTSGARNDKSGSS